MPTNHVSWHANSMSVHLQVRSIPAFPINTYTTGLWTTLWLVGGPSTPFPVMLLPRHQHNAYTHGHTDFCMGINTYFHLNTTEAWTRSWPALDFKILPLHNLPHDPIFSFPTTLTSLSFCGLWDSILDQISCFCGQIASVQIPATMHHHLPVVRSQAKKFHLVTHFPWVQNGDDNSCTYALG